AARDQPPLAAPNFDVIENGLARGRTDHRPHESRTIFRSANLESRDFSFQLFDELIVDRVVYNGARAGRALLPLITERGLHHTRDGAVQIGLPIDYDGVFTAHLGHHALDPDLAFARLRSQLIDAQTHF